MEQEKKSLYNITHEINAIEHLFELSGGEITDELETLQKEVELMLLHKTDSCLGFLSMQTDKLELVKNKIAEMNDFKKSIENKIDKFKDYLLLCVESTPDKQIVGQFSKVKIRKPRKIVNIVDENKIPINFLSTKTVITPDKKALLDALKTGEKIDGCNLIEGSKSISISLNK